MKRENRKLTNRKIQILSNSLDICIYHLNSFVGKRFDSIQQVKNAKSLRFTDCIHITESCLYVIMIGHQRIPDIKICDW